MNKMNQSFILDITVISAQGLKDDSSSSLFTYYRRLRPFTTITTNPPTYKHRPVAATYKTKVDDQGGCNPTWGDKFELPLDPSLFNYQTHSCIYLQVYTKHFLVGYTQLGWCQIPVADILDGLLPAGSLRHLAYQLRARDGSRGHGIVNVAVKLESAIPVTHPQWSSSCNNANSPKINGTHVVICLPITVSPPVAAHGDKGKDMEKHAYLIS